MACKPGELAILKGTSCKIDDVVFILAFCVHTEEMEDPITKQARKNHSKSRYVYLGRIIREDDLKREIADCMSDANRMSKWKWPGMNDYDCMSYDNDNTSGRAGKWLNMRLKKALAWSDFVKVLDGFKFSRNAYSEFAKYHTDNYIVSDGTEISDLKSAKDTIKSLVGKTMMREKPLKSLISK